jgi:SAM-dependent methyltransferase
MKAFQKVQLELRKIWMRIALRNVRYSNNVKSLDRFYMLKDPWVMSSIREQYRFEETNRLIQEKFGRVGSLLEIGCGEGHQSVHLQKVCDCLTGLDVSGRAIERARMRCPNGVFLVGNVFTKEVNTLYKFDLVVACEVLYYLKEIPLALQRIRAIGDKGLVTYFDGEMENMDQYVLPLTGVASKIWEFNHSRWRAAWW